MSKTECGHHIITDGCLRCRDVQSKWYRILKQKDFDDIESTRYPERPLKVWHGSAFKDVTKFEIEDTLEYYQKAAHFLNSYPFENETLRSIWELHCEGMSRHKIEIAIKNLPHACKQSTIRNLVKRFNREMEEINSMIITTRKFLPDTDTGLILESMGKAIYYDSYPKKGRPSPKWFGKFNDYFADLITRADIFIAISSDDPNLILGFSVFDGDQLEFVYTKDAYRQQGIATMLVNEKPYISINEANKTKLGRKILMQKSQALEAKVEDVPESKIEDSEKISAWIKGGIAVKKATFQSAVLSGYNAAEYQLSVDSTNKTRVPESMYYTQGGLIVNQNKQQFIVPLANIIQVCT